MRQRTALAVVGLMIFSAPSAFAQVEVSLNVGYSASEGVETDGRTLLGSVFNSVDVQSGSSVNLTFGYFLTEQLQFEFLWGRQNSRFQADGPSGTRPISDLSIDNYMFNFVYNSGESDSRVRAYGYGGGGATHYSFGDFLLPPIGTSVNRSIDNETRFSTNWGAGVKFYFSPHVGAKVGVRWTPTYVKSDPAGMWCDPYYGCWSALDADYSHQFESAAGVTFRF